MMKCPNVIFILGNHDFIMYTLMKKLSVEVTEENYENYLTFDILLDYSKRYYPDETIFLVTGHTPTVLINDWGKSEVYRKNGHIALDCACVSGGKLAVFCVETEEAIYVDGR